MDLLFAFFRTAPDKPTNQPCSVTCGINDSHSPNAKRNSVRPNQPTPLPGSVGVRPPVTGLFHSDENVGAGISLQPAISPHTGDGHRSLRWFYGTVKPPPMQIESSRIVRGSRQTAGQHRRILIYCQ